MTGIFDVAWTCSGGGVCKEPQKCREQGCCNERFGDRLEERKPDALSHATCPVHSIRWDTRIEERCPLCAYESPQSKIAATSPDGGTGYINGVWHEPAQRAAAASGNAQTEADSSAQTAAHPTPRTDAQWKPGLEPDGVVSANFARQLERELDSSVEAGARMIEDIDSYKRENAELRAHLDRLTGMKFSERMHAALVSRVESAERQRDEARKDAERYLDGFTVLLAYAYQMGFFTADDSTRVRVWLEACPPRPGVTVGTAIDAALKESKNGES